MRAGMLKNVGLVDLETGQLLEPVKIYLFGRPKGDKGFVKVFYAFLETVMEDRDIMRGPYRLLVYIMSERLKPNSLEFSMALEEVCQKLGISEATYKRWVSVLIKKGYIVRVANNIYKLKPYSAVIGTMTEVEDF